MKQTEYQMILKQYMKQTEYQTILKQYMKQSNQVPVPVTSPKPNQSFKQTKQNKTKQLKTRTPSKTFRSIPAGTENETPVLIAVPAPVF